MSKLSSMTKQLVERFGIEDPVDGDLLDYNVKNSLLNRMGEVAIRSTHFETQAVYHDIRFERAKKELAELEAQRNELDENLIEELVEVMRKHGSEAGALEYLIAQAQGVVEEERRYAKYQDELRILRESYSKENEGNNAV